MSAKMLVAISCLLALSARTAIGQEWWKPYSPPCTERENVFEFTEKPTVKLVGKDRYEITFAVKGYCDVTVAIVDPDPTKELVKGRGIVVRHLASGVLGPNAPPPFQKNSLRQTLYWNGKDDLDLYVKEPAAVKARVQLGLKPVFERLLGTTNTKNIPGKVLGFAVDPDGVYVFSQARIVYIRKFDHDARYVKSLVPPPSDLPEAKLGGRTFIEYEPGKRSHHGPYIMQDMGFNGNCMPGLDDIGSIQAAVSGGRIFFCNGGADFHRKTPSFLYYIYTDGSTDVRGLKGRPFIEWKSRHEQQRFAVSPDQKWVYMVGLTDKGDLNAGAVLRFAADDDRPAIPFAGKVRGTGARTAFDPGSDNQSLNNPTGIDCDATGRVYVADRHNNRIQVFTPDDSTSGGKYLKTIPVSGVHAVQVHKKSGAIYALHHTTIKGRTAGRLTKFTSFDNPEPEFSKDWVYASTFVVDSWTPRPRIWLNGFMRELPADGRMPEFNNVIVLEEDGKELKLVADFDAEVRREAGSDYTGRWSGGVFDHVVGDPVREEIYYGIFRANALVFDPATGKPLRVVKFPAQMNDIAFDKRGYMHCHIDPGFGLPGVIRLDPRQASPYKDFWGVHPEFTVYKEVPYDYGVELHKPQVASFIGGLPVKDQPGAKYFQDGFGVNMRGDVAEQCNIYYIPKMEEEGFAAAYIGPKVRVARGGTWFTDTDPYAAYMKNIQEQLRRGDEIYAIKRRPGVPLAGGTVWTFDSTGELRDECAVIASRLVVGLHIDEEGFLYFGNDRARLLNGKPFLQGRGGNLLTDTPVDPHNRTPVTYTVVKSRRNEVRWLLKDAKIPMEPPPDRPTDLVSFGPFGAPEMGGGEAWTEGVLWAYAGLSPAVPAGCTCPATRFHLDWYKRSYIPEAYRRSVGILDTNGNLIMHFGRYGNLDDALRMKRGSEDIALTLPRFIGGTDNYLCFDDWGERLVLLKLDYHAEESVGISDK